jgi:hypothetical protein
MDHETPSRPPRQRLSDHEAQLLDAGGLPLPKRLYSARSDPAARTIAALAAICATSLRVPEAADRLGVQPGRVRQRLSKHTLYGFKIRGTCRLPAFQFTAGGEVPGIGRVLVRLNPALHPVGIVTWFTQPDPDFRVDGREASPRDWLLSGGSPHFAAEDAAWLGAGM